MTVSLTQILVTAVVSAVVSAVVAAWVTWWHRSVVRWAITTNADMYFVANRDDPIDPVYFRFGIHNIGDADAYGVKVMMGDHVISPLTPSVKAGASLLQDAELSFEHAVAQHEISTRTFEISFYESPVWRKRRVFRVGLAELQKRELMLSDAHLPWLIRWLGFGR